MAPMMSAWFWKPMLALVRNLIPKPTEQISNCRANHLICLWYLFSVFQVSRVKRVDRQWGTVIMPSPNSSTSRNFCWLMGISTTFALHTWCNTSFTRYAAVTLPSYHSSGWEVIVGFSKACISQTNPHTNLIWGLWGKETDLTESILLS